MQQLAQFNGWEAAENFVRKLRSTPMQQFEQTQFDQEIADRYIRDRRFESIPNEILQKNSFKGRDLDLFKMIVQPYQNASQTTQRRSFLEKISAADPANRELAFQLAGLYDDGADGEKKAAILQRLVEQEPNNFQYRQSYGEALMAIGRSDEALKAAAEWAADKPVEARYSLLSQLQQKAGRFREARQSLLNS